MKQVFENVTYLFIFEDIGTNILNRDDMYLLSTRLLEFIKYLTAAKFTKDQNEFGLKKTISEKSNKTYQVQKKMNN